jgi:hypothetical protein
VLDYARQTQPDFQRPGGDYGSWYIRDSYTGTILHGFEYWDFIEGALLRFLIEGPMHWLGLVKAGQGTLLKTALGEGFCTGDWPSRADPEVSISVDQQGVITVPLRLARYDRLQIARFTSWIGSPGPSQFVPTGRNRESGDYLYRLTAQSLNRAKEQGIEIATHVIPFLGRLSAGSVPRNVSEMLEGWYNRTDEVIVHDVVIVAAKDLGIDERVRNNKRAGKWLGQQVGPHAYTVQREDLPPLLNALREMGLLPHFKGHEKDDWP